MSDVNFQNNNSLNDFLVITEATEYGQVDVSIKPIIIHSMISY